VTGGPAARPVALVTYSTRPRGGVVHTLALAEALHAIGHPVHVFALGDPAAGFFRPVHAPYTVLPAPTDRPTLDAKVFACIDALADGLAAGGFDLVHTQDCIAARAACRVRDALPAHGPRPLVIRTVHHMEDFTSPVLVECQRQAVLEPDVVLVVSEHWRRELRDEYGVEAATVVHNGVQYDRFRSVDPALPARLRRAVNAGGRPLLLAVGGVEPRKGSDSLVAALGELRRELAPPPVLVVIGGHSFQDHRAYRDRVLATLPGLGLVPGEDVVLRGMVPDTEVPGWYAAADALAFPSVKEGWGLAVLEAMSAGLPVVTSDLPVFREYLSHGHDALLVPPGDVGALRDALAAVLLDTALRARLRAGGDAVARRFTWAASAREHQRLYCAWEAAIRRRDPATLGGGPGRREGG
jgi:glycosyltransferase-like protein